MRERVASLVVDGPGALRVDVAEEEATPGDGHFRVRTDFSGVSLGTELTWFRGTNPYLHAGWDADLGLFRHGRPSAAYPLTRFGYMQVGRVVATRTRAVEDGATVAMAYGHRTAYTADPLADRFVPLPDDLDPLLGVLVAHLGPICANGLLHAAQDAFGAGVRDLGDGVRGRDVAVVGAGLIGLLTGVFCRHLGAAEVWVVDRTPRRLAAAAALGLQPLDSAAIDDPGLLLKERLAHGPRDRGASVVFQCRGQAAALATALRCARPQGTVVDLAFYPGGADEVRLGEEFHHNGLSLRCAQIGRVPRGLAAAWDRNRLSAETVHLLRAQGAAVRAHVLDTVVPFGEAPALFAGVSEHRRDVTAAVLDCRDAALSVPAAPPR